MYCYVGLDFHEILIPFGSGRVERTREAWPMCQELPKPSEITFLERLLDVVIVG
tara:strand:+ start:197 stop:358 length:162 start_codon:yes stop_codon:yes gene_type:complete